jgi:hypothetical protein
MNRLWTAIRTNEDGVRTQLIIATAITGAAIGLGIYVTKKNSPVPVILTVVPDATEVITDAVQA